MCALEHWRGEAKTIQTGSYPCTRNSIAEELRALGMCEGMLVMMHSSLSSMGWVCGGPMTVILALQDVLTSSGTLVMPTHTAYNSEPSEWQAPPVPESIT